MLFLIIVQHRPPYGKPCVHSVHVSSEICRKENLHVPLTFMNNQFSAGITSFFVHFFRAHKKRKGMFSRRIDYLSIILYPADIVPFHHSLASLA